MHSHRVLRGAGAANDDHKVRSSTTLNIIQHSVGDGGEGRSAEHSLGQGERRAGGGPTDGGQFDDGRTTDG